MPTRYGISPWIDRIPSKKRPSYPSFRGDIEAPLVIIGGGLSGVMTAYAAAAAGIKAVLLEADHLGHGGSGSATGICAGEGAASFVGQQAAAGRRVARAQFEQLRRAVLDLATTTRRLALDARVEAKAAIRLAQPGASTGLLRKDIEARREAGLDASWITSGAGVDVEVGARLAPWAVCDPYALVLGFGGAARARGAHVFERSPVTKIAFDRVKATVLTANGRIVTPHVVHATGEPTRLVAGLKRHFRYESRGLALSEPVPLAVRKAVGSRDHVVYDVDVPPHAIRWTADHRVLVSGRDAKRPKPVHLGKIDVPRTGELMYELSRLYPDISGVMPAFGWSLSVAHSVDGGLLVGPHRNFPHQLFAFGTAHDPARTYLASRILLRHVQGTTTRDDEPFGFARTLHS